MELILFPFGGNAKEAIFVIEEINRMKPTWQIIGFIDDNLELTGREYSSYKVMGGREKISEFQSAKILAVPGRPEDFYKRKEMIDSLGISGTRFATIIHPSACISSATAIGNNTLIMAGVVTTAMASIGNHCVILPNTVISHDVVIDDYTLVGSNVSISGGVHIESLCYIGTGSRIMQELRIGRGSLIGMGTNVLKSVEPNSVVVGNPGRIIRKVQ